MKNGEALFIYLDQNKWIDLARAYHNRADGKQFKSVLQKVINAVESKKSIFPLSGFHYAETQKNGNPSRRQRLAKVMATISQGWTISIGEDITKTEMKIAGAKIFEYTPPTPPNVFGHGMAFALGIDLHSLMAIEFNDPLATSDNFIHLLESFTSTPQMTEFLLAGMGNEESKLIEAKNEYEENLSEFADATEKFRAQLRPHPKLEADHKRLYIANLQLVLGEMINNALSAYEKSIDEIISMGENKFINFIEGVPSLDVETQLVIRRNANWGKVVDKNDLADISVLTIAIPYCDIVVTENTWKDLAMRSGLDKKYNTVVISDINELNGYL